MPRFDRLELDPSRDRPDDGGDERAEVDRDEHYWLRLADAERRRGLYDNALRYYSRSLELDKSQAVGWIGQVQMLVALDEIVEAELWARKALDLFKNHGDLLAGRAQALCRSKDSSQASAVCDAALSQPNATAYRWQVRGEVMIMTRSSVDRYCFEKAMQLDPDWMAPLEIAQAYFYHGYPSKALGYARQAVSKGADEAFPWYFQGVCERDLELSDAAVRSFRRVLEIIPNHADAQRHLTELKHQGWSLMRTMRRLFRR